MDLISSDNQFYDPSDYFYMIKQRPLPIVGLVSV